MLKAFGYIERVVKSDFFRKKNLFSSFVRNVKWATIYYKNLDYNCYDLLNCKLASGRLHYHDNSLARFKRAGYSRSYPGNILGVNYNVSNFHIDFCIYIATCTKELLDVYWSYADLDPQNLVNAVPDQGQKNTTFISNHL